MGSWFSNIQIRRPAPNSSFDAERITALLIKDLDLAIASQDDADLVVTVFMPEGSQWISVASDVIDGDVDALLRCAKEISVELQAETLAVSCFDSDYLFMNLIYVQNNTDAWASCGRYPDGKAPRRSNFTAWKPYIEDLPAFRNAMRAKYVCAEECLSAVAPLLSLPVRQSMMDPYEEPDSADVLRFFYKYNSSDASARPPAFAFGVIRSIYYHTGGDDNLVAFLNQGDASRGVAVCLTGPCVSEHQLASISLRFQYRARGGEWAFLPVELQPRTFQSGVVGLYGERRDVRIPPAVPDGLPWRKKMEMEFDRALTIRFSLTAAVTDSQLGDLHVILIPLQNPSGQIGAVLKHKSKG